MQLVDLLKKIRTRINKIFVRQNTNPPSPEISQKISQPKVSTQSGPHAPGLDCPRCSYRIATTIEMLISGQPIYCKACGLKISINHEESKECLTEVKKLHDAVKKVEKVKAQVKAK